jgi:hypothetical protein
MWIQAFLLAYRHQGIERLTGIYKVMHPAPPNELLIAIARGNAVVFVGSGPSMASGFPSWQKLLELMLDFCKMHSISVPNQSDIEQLINAQNFLLVAEALRAKMGDEKWFEFLRETFDRPSAPLTEFHRLLVRIPFAAAQQLALNYRNLSVDHSIQVRLTTACKSKVLRRVRE